MNRRAEILSLLSEPLAVGTDLAVALMEFANNEAATDFPLLTRELATSEEQAQARFVSVVPASEAVAMSMGVEPAQATVACILVEGVIMDYNWYGSSEWYCRVIRQYAQDPSCSAIVLRMNSSGGLVTAAERIAECIAEVEKPVVCLVDKMALSAAYWIASACDAIYVTGETSALGSIGVMTTIWINGKGSPDYGKYVSLYATTSGKKNEAIRALAKGDDSKMIARLNQLDAIFMSQVKANRGAKIDGKNTLEGQDYLAADALKYGLADGQCCLEDCVEMAPTVPKRDMENNDVNPENENMGLFGSDLPKDVKALAVADASTITEAQLDSANAALAAAGIAAFELVRIADVKALQAEAQTLNTEKASLTTKVADLTAKLETAEQSLATANANLATAQGQIASLGGKPATEPANPASSSPAESSANNGQIVFLCEADRILYERTGINPYKKKVENV